MNRRCRSCGRTGPVRGTRHPSRGHRRTEFGRVSFWTWVALVLAVVWVYAEIRGAA